MGHLKETQVWVGQGAKGLFFHFNRHDISLKYAAGQGTNNRAEFYALWLLLKTVADKGLTHLQVRRDSKMLMN